MDNIDAELTELLFTKIGMIMEDAVPSLLSVRPTDGDAMEAKIFSVRWDVDRISALAHALAVLRM